MCSLGHNVSVIYKQSSRCMTRPVHQTEFANTLKYYTISTYYTSNLLSEYIIMLSIMHAGLRYIMIMNSNMFEICYLKMKLK